MSPRGRSFVKRECHARGMGGEYPASVMDALLAAQRFPALTLQAMRGAIGTALASRRIAPPVLVGDALIRFERMVAREAPDGVRPALLFAERDRIVRELRGFITTRLASRLFTLAGHAVIALEGDAKPFDAVVRNASGEFYAVALRRLPSDGRRLEMLLRIREAAIRYRPHPLHGVVVYDFSSVTVRHLPLSVRRPKAA